MTAYLENFKELATALAKAQANIQGAKKDVKNDFFKSKYADLASCWEACRKELTDQGLSIVQLPCEAPEGSVGLVTYILHSSGQSIGEKFFMPVKDAKNPQAVGSALTYARRYALCAAVGIAPEDDDGNAATGQSRPGAGHSVTKSIDVTVVPKDWGRIAKESLDQLIAAKNHSEQRMIHSLVRSSDMPEPAKTQLLTEMATFIKSQQKK